MKKEIRLKLKQYESDFDKFLKSNCKNYGLKKKSCYLWRADKTMFFYIMTNLWFDEEKQSFRCSFTAYVKPLWTDELLWKLMGMEDNLKSPLSLRCNGAFTFYGLKYCCEAIDFESVEISGEKLLNMIREAAVRFDESYFYAHADQIDYQSDVFDLLYAIHRGDYSEARNKADSTINKSCFVNEGKSLKQRVIEYCDKLIV